MLPMREARSAALPGRDKHRVNRIGIVLRDLDGVVMLVQMGFAVLVAGVPRPVVAERAVQAEERAIELAVGLFLRRAGGVFRTALRLIRRGSAV